MTKKRKKKGYWCHFQHVLAGAALHTGGGEEGDVPVGTLTRGDRPKKFDISDFPPRERSCEPGEAVRATRRCHARGRGGATSPRGSCCIL